MAIIIGGNKSPKQQAKRRQTGRFIYKAEEKHRKHTKNGQNLGELKTRASGNGTVWKATKDGKESWLQMEARM